MALEYANVLWAAGACSSNGTPYWEEECEFARSGTGTYTVTLARPLDATYGGVAIQRRGATGTQPMAPKYVWTSDTVLTITFATGTGETPTDTDFDVLVYRRRGGAAA